MGPVGVVERARDVVVLVIAVRDSFVAAGSPVLFAALDGRARVRPFPVHFEAVLVEMVPVRRVQVAVVEIVRMVAVAHGLVAAARTVLVSVILVLAAGHVGPPLASSLASTRGSTVG
jgi:hypothetical protein